MLEMKMSAIEQLLLTIVLLVRNMFRFVSNCFNNFIDLGKVGDEMLQKTKVISQIF